jgi:hypothetical protein
MGTAKARVLPEPVFDRPSTSWPSRASGITRAWIGNGLDMPRSERTRSTVDETPSSGKDGVREAGATDMFTPSATDTRGGSGGGSA